MVVGRAVHGILSTLNRIFYAWELGANLGHMGAFMPLAKALRERGHAVHWAVPQPTEAAQLLAPAGFAWLQAPGVSDRAPGHTPENYASILLHHGWGAFSSLLGLVVAWRELLKLTGAQVVLVDHAPTAILAARTLGLPVMIHGNGFTVPPQMHPTPAMRSWADVPSALLLQNDQTALTHMNAVLAHWGCAPLRHLAELFAVAEPTLLTFPELDHYSQRSSARYWGTASMSTGVVPEWPKGDGPRVFAYVRPAGAHHRAVLDSLTRLSARVLVYAPGLPETVQQALTNERLCFARRPVDIARAAHEAQMGVMWGGGGVSAVAFLRAGTPVLILPNQLEPFLQGLQIQAMGAGLVADLDRSLDRLPHLLTQLLTEDRFQVAAQAFAQRYAQWDEAGLVDRMRQRVERLCAEVQAFQPSEITAANGTPGGAS